MQLSEVVEAVVFVITLGLIYGIYSHAKGSAEPAAVEPEAAEPEVDLKEASSMKDVPEVGLSEGHAEGEETRRCAGCGSERPLKSFSKKQLKRKAAAQRRCETCLGRFSPPSEEATLTTTRRLHLPWLRGALETLPGEGEERVTWSWTEATECPICYEALSADPAERSYKFCCGQTICTRCIENMCKNDPSVLLVSGTTIYQRKDDLGRSVATRCFFCRASSPLEGGGANVQIEEAARKGDACALYHLGRNCLERRELKQGWAHVRASAARGYALALSFLGNYYQDHTEPRRYVDAVHCYRAAAARGNFGGLANLAQMLLFGVPFDYRTPFAPLDQCQLLQDPDVAIELYEAGGACTLGQKNIVAACAKVKTIAPTTFSDETRRPRDDDRETTTCKAHVLSDRNVNNGDVRCSSCGKATTCERCVTFGAYRCRTCRAILRAKCRWCLKSHRVDRFAYLCRTPTLAFFIRAAEP